MSSAISQGCCRLVIILLLFQTGIGCQDGWVQYHTKCYFFSKSKVNFQTAANFCHLLGGKLAEPVTKTEANFLRQEVISVGKDKPFYIGVTDMFVDNDWVYMSNNQLVPDNVIDWRPGEPNGALNENCVFTSSTRWIDIPCETNYNFICEKTINVNGENIIG